MRMASKTKSSTKSAKKKSAAKRPKAKAKTKAKTKTASAKKKTGRKTAGRKKAAKSGSRAGSATASARTSRREKDPRGGLTAAGRKAFAERDGSHLKPGVTKPLSEMSPMEMKRKGSWAVRFYARDKLPALVDRNGDPTRFALSAHAWGEPVPKTEAAARRIAAKGERLLKRYRRTQQKA